MIEKGGSRERKEKHCYEEEVKHCYEEVKRS